eukprot:GHVN01039872.1.p1 GENE.GHVN01039872.1~~GHVN01039872.1.p1  ORF type:complete len:641 (-),score=169.47 GHVN01039872.1:846-2768(-)
MPVLLRSKYPMPVHIPGSKPRSLKAPIPVPSPHLVQGFECRSARLVTPLRSQYNSRMCPKGILCSLPCAASSASTLSVSDLSPRLDYLITPRVVTMLPDPASAESDHKNLSYHQRSQLGPSRALTTWSAGPATTSRAPHQHRTETTTPTSDISRVYKFTVEPCPINRRRDMIEDIASAYPHAITKGEIDRGDGIDERVEAMRDRAAGSPLKYYQVRCERNDTLLHTAQHTPQHIAQPPSYSKPSRLTFPIASSRSDKIDMAPQVNRGGPSIGTPDTGRSNPVSHRPYSETKAAIIPSTPTTHLGERSSPGETSKSSPIKTQGDEDTSDSDMGVKGAVGRCNVSDLSAINCRSHTAPLIIARPPTDGYLPHPSSHLPHPSSHLPHPSSHLPHPSSHLPHPPSHLPDPSSHLPHPSSHLPHPSSHLPHPSSHPSHLPYPPSHLPQMPHLLTHIDISSHSTDLTSTPFSNVMGLDLPSPVHASLISPTEGPQQSVNGFNQQGPSLTMLSRHLGSFCPHTYNEDEIMAYWSFHSTDRGQTRGGGNSLLKAPTEDNEDGDSLASDRSEGLVDQTHGAHNDPLNKINGIASLNQTSMSYGSSSRIRKLAEIQPQRKESEGESGQQRVKVSRLRRTETNQEPPDHVP